MEINIVKNHQKNRPARGYVKGLIQLPGKTASAPGGGKTVSRTKIKYIAAKISN